MSWGLSVICLSLLPLANASQKPGKELVQEVVADLCPFSTYCHTNATRQLIEGYSRNDLCCRSCSCESDCWKMGNCCIDKDGVADKLPVFNCKESMVKKESDDTDVYRRLDEKHRRYLIIDYCPEAKIMPVLETKCRSKQPKSLEELVWVSDKESGIIYQNQYCAECHGIENYTHWQISTQCDGTLQTNFSSLFSKLSSDNCSIINIAPDNIHDIVDKYSCFIPIYDKCNLTGFWSNFDQDILSACNKFDLPFLQPVFSGSYLSYKNIFCYLCNSNGPFFDFCPNLFGVVKSVIVEFSALINFDLYMEIQDDNKENQERSRCREDEFFDIYMEVCRQLLCPYGKAPLYGSCEQLALATDGLGIEVVYYLSVQTDSKHRPIFMDENNLALLRRNLLNRFFTSTGLRKLDCECCYIEIRATKHENQTIGMFTGFYILGLFRTKTHCQIDKIVNLIKEFNGKSLKVHVADNDYIVLQARLETSTESEVRQSSELIDVWKGAICRRMITFLSERFCSAVELNSLEISSLVDVKRKTLLMAVFESKQHSSGVLRLCLDEYYSIMAQNSSAGTIVWHDVRYQFSVLIFVLQVLI